MCLLASGLNMVQQAVEVPGERAFRRQAKSGIITLLAGILKVEKAKTETEGESRTTLGFRQLLSWPHPKRNNFCSVPWLLPLPPPSSFPSAFFGHFPPE